MTTLDDKLREIYADELDSAWGKTDIAVIPDNVLRMMEMAAIAAMRRACALGRASVYEANESVREEDMQAIYQDEWTDWWKENAGDIPDQRANEIVAYRAMKRLHGLLTDPDNPPLTEEQLAQMKWTKL